MIDVFVGKSSTLWRIHKKILLLQSEFFQAALKGPFTEGIENKVVLPEEKNEIFTLFVQWIYSQSFMCGVTDLLLRAYVMGDRFGAFAFRQEVLNKVYQLNTTKPCFTVAQVVWVAENTLPTSMLRTLTMDTVAIAILNKDLDPTPQDWELLGPISTEILQSMSSVAKLHSSRRFKPKPALHYNE